MKSKTCFLKAQHSRAFKKQVLGFSSIRVPKQEGKTLIFGDFRESRAAHHVPENHPSGSAQH